jgi:hypothetical protein
LICVPLDELDDAVADMRTAMAEPWPRWS